MESAILRLVVALDHLDSRIGVGITDGGRVTPRDSTRFVSDPEKLFQRKRTNQHSSCNH